MEASLVGTETETGAVELDWGGRVAGGGWTGSATAPLHADLASYIPRGRDLSGSAVPSSARYPVQRLHRAFG